MTHRTPRHQAWIILSELFVDNDVTDSLPWMTAALRALPFDSDTLEDILMDEVYPVLIGNLFQVAGNWTGFDEDELVQEIERTIARWHPLSKLSGLWRRRQARWSIPEWTQIRAELRQSET